MYITFFATSSSSFYYYDFFLIHFFSLLSDTFFFTWEHSPIPFFHIYYYGVYIYIYINFGSNTKFSNCQFFLFDSHVIVIKSTVPYWMYRCLIRFFLVAPSHCIRNVTIKTRTDLIFSFLSLRLVPLLAAATAGWLAGWLVLIDNSRFFSFPEPQFSVADKHQSNWFGSIWGPNKL